MNLEELKLFQDKLIKKNKKINIISCGIIIPILLITIFLLIYSDIKSPAYFFIPFVEIVLSVVICAIVRQSTLGKDICLFRKEFKRIFVLNSLQKVFDNLKYDYESGLTESMIKSTKMMNTYDRFSSNDLISGNYKGVNFMQSDVKIEEECQETDSDGNTSTYWETIFMGRWMIFDFNKEFKANMQVASAGFEGNTLHGSKYYHKVKLEDIEFNKKFSVYAQNEHEAFYILTPHFMEKIKNIASTIKGRIMFCFIDSKLHVAINNYADSFEYNPFKKINEDEIKQTIMNDIKLITALVDDLNLDNNLFKKEV